MAYNSKQALNLTGVELRKMTRSEISRVVSTLASAGNKRIVRMEKAGQPITQTVRKFSVAGKTKNELMKEFTRVKNFMQSETQSLRGQKEIARKVSRGLAERTLGKKSDALEYGEKTKFKKIMREYDQMLSGSYRGTNNKTTFWRAYERLKERNPIIAQKGYKYKILEKQAQIMRNAPSISTARLTDRMQKVFDEMYIEEQNEVNNAPTKADGIRFSRTKR